MTPIIGHFDLHLENIPRFIHADDSCDIYHELLQLDFHVMNFHFGDNSVTPKRKVFAYADEGVRYPFTGLNIRPAAWSPLMLVLKKSVESKTGEKFNFALLNLYPDGESKLSPHRDDEKCLDPKVCIPTLSFGAERFIFLQHKKWAKREAMMISGSLLIMQPPTIQYWKHYIPAMPDVK